MSFGTQTAASKTAAAPAPSAASKADKPKALPALTADEFIAAAEAVECNIAGYPVILEPKMFSTGSYGYGVVGAPPSVTVKLGGKAVKLCLSLSLVVANSKPQGK